MAAPNILHIFTDQQRFDTIRALGNGVIRTPHLDRLCNEGTAFTSTYSPSPVCVPARSSMIYGQYPHNTKCYENPYSMPEDGRHSIMDALSVAGYRTHGIGKCHFMPDAKAMRGFQTRETQEEMCGERNEDDYMRFQMENGLEHLVDPHAMRSEMYYVPQPAQMPARLHPTNWIGDRSVAFIKEQKSTNQPWYLFAGFIHPHPPFAPPAPWYKLYRAPLMPLPKVPRDWEALLCHVNRHQNRYKYRDQGIDTNLVRCMKAFYYACISFIDFQVGRMYEALESTGQLDNTLIVFCSDHGELLGDYNSFGKRSMHDSCARVPLIVRMPGVFEGAARVDEPTSLVDVAPTMLARAGVELSTHTHDGVDLAEVAAGRSAERMIFSQLNNAGDAVYMSLDREWKYVYSAPDAREFLFDRIGDPMETRNRAGLSFTKEPLERMRSAVLEVLEQAGEEQAVENGTWRNYPTKSVPEDPDAGLLIQDHKWTDVRLPGYSEENAGVGP